MGAEFRSEPGGSSIELAPNRFGWPHHNANFISARKPREAPISPLTKLAGLLSAAAIRQWMGTVEYKCAYYDPNVDPATPGQRIYIFWHEYILFPLYLRGHCNVAMLLSQHRDADVLTRLAHYMGFDFVRGSTYRGGTKALRQLARIGRKRNLAITPDGPRGPRRQLAQGAIYLAAKLQLPLVPVGFGYDRPWRVRSWDRFAIPRPGTRARAVLGPEVLLPSGLDRDGIEHYRSRLEKFLLCLTCEAETWAESGNRKPQEVPMRRESLRRAAASEGYRPVEAEPSPDHLFRLAA